MSPSQLCDHHKRERVRVLARRRARKKRTGDPEPDLHLTPSEARATLAAFNQLFRAERQFRAELQEHGLRPASLVQAILDAAKHLRTTLGPGLAEAEREYVEARRGKTPGHIDS